MACRCHCQGVEFSASDCDHRAWLVADCFTHRTWNTRSLQLQYTDKHPTIAVDDLSCRIVTIEECLVPAWYSGTVECLFALITQSIMLQSAERCSNLVDIACTLVCATSKRPLSKLVGISCGWSSAKIPNEAKSEQQAYNAFYGFLCVC